MKVKLRRNRHNLSHYSCGTCFPGEIVPVSVVEVVPGDSFNHKINSLIRFNALNAPVMHRIHQDIYSFFVPYRVIWSGFEDFICRVTGASGVPTMTLGNIKADADCKRLADYFGLNTDQVVAASTTTVSALPFWAYFAIFNEWFRDKDLVTELDATSVTASDYSVLRASWRKDYLTGARPWPQLGAAVTIPLGVDAPVTINEANIVGGALGNLGNLNTGVGGYNVAHITQDLALQEIELTGTANLTAASSSTVTQLRRAFNLQALAERLLNFGHDYPALLASMGVSSKDGRLQRPEYLGGSKANVSVSEVLQTAEGTTTPVGEMRGHAISPNRGAPYRRFFEEHGVVMSVMVVRPDPIYNSVIDRMWFHGLEDGANDFYTPELERIGSQEILNKEVYATNPAGADEAVFGYNKRYYEYTQKLSRVAGLFRVGQSLDYWTWARGFTSAPALNSTFINCDPGLRIFADTVSQPILYAVNHTLIAQRMMTKQITGRTF